MVGTLDGDVGVDLLEHEVLSVNLNGLACVQVEPLGLSGVTTVSVIPAEHSEEARAWIMCKTRQETE